MRLNDSYTLMEFRGNNLLVRKDRKKGRVSLEKGLLVNGSFAFLWKTFTGVEFSVQDLSAALASEYDITQEEAVSAASEIVSLWRENSMIQE